MNYSRIPGPGDLSGPPDDDFSDTRWETCVERRVEKLCDDGALVQEMVETLAAGGAWLAVYRALHGDPLGPGDRHELERLLKVCSREHERINDLYNERDDY